MLKNGGMLRGTISELVPNDYVVIALAGGESRRLAMTEVRFAGRAEDAPRDSKPPPEQPAPAQEVRPAVVLHAQEARLRFESDDPDVTFHRQTGSAQAVAIGRGGIARAESVAYDEICTAPCEATMAAGSYSFALSRGTGAAVPVEDRVVASPGATTLRGTYTSYTGVRVAGWITLVGGAIGGTALVATSFSGDGEGRKGQMIAGFVVMGVGMTVGWVLTLKSDEAAIDVAGSGPGVAPARTGSKRTPGLSVAGVF
jgi:hypothetical protein